MYILPQLPYSFDALEPVIDSQTVQIHHDKHHQTYVNKLNELLVDLPEFNSLELEDLIKNIAKIPENIRQAVFNNAGQVYNHNLYWESLTPTPKLLDTSSNLSKAINETFGSLETLKTKLLELATTQFGSGWAWLSVDASGKLVAEKTSNAESPLVSGKKPLLTIDVWEHAYYLKYQNLRPKYVESVATILNWELASQKYDAIVK
jgi:Fe-Mn family superoxide dismutase